jgi:hypothetical protein
MGPEVLVVDDTLTTGETSCTTYGVSWSPAVLEGGYSSYGYDLDHL